MAVKIPYNAVPFHSTPFHVVVTKCSIKLILINAAATAAFFFSLHLNPFNPIGDSITM